MHRKFRVATTASCTYAVAAIFPSITPKSLPLFICNGYPPALEQNKLVHCADSIG